MSTPGNLAAVEAGGTRFLCAPSTPGENVPTQVTFPTPTPAQTLADLADVFPATQARHGCLVTTTFLMPTAQVGAMAQIGAMAMARRAAGDA